MLGLTMATGAGRPTEALLLRLFGYAKAADQKKLHIS